MESTTQCLAGVRVLDLGAGPAARLAARFLAEAGATVDRLDTARADAICRFAPITAEVTTRNRASTASSAGVAEARRWLDERLADADVLLHDLPAGVPLLTGLHLQREFPHLVVAVCTPIVDGRSDEETSDLLAQARVGLPFEQASVSGQPMMLCLPVCDVSAAYLLAIGVIAHLVARERTGRGGSFHTSLEHGGLLATALYWPRVPTPPAGMDLDTLAKFGTPTSRSLFQAADGEWLQLMGAYATSAPVLEALAHRDATALAIEGVTDDNIDAWRAVFAQRPRQDWLTDLWAADVPCMPVLHRGELLDTESARLAGAAVEVAEGDRVTTQNGQPFSCEARDTASDRSAGPTTNVPATDGRAGPLAGIRVIDLGVYVAGPFAAQLLADLGAEVVKVEPPQGDPGRRITQFLACQRGKQSIGLDLKRESATAVVHALVRWSDVVINNMRASAARKLGIDDESLRELKPTVVHGTVSGFGRSGPWAGLPGFDPTAQALSGWQHAIVPEGAAPMYMRNSIMDTHCGCALALGVLAALFYRARTGAGSEVHASLLGVAAASDCGVQLDADGRIALEHSITADQFGTGWNQRLYETADGWIAISAIADDEQGALQSLANLPNTPDDVEAGLERWFAASTGADVHKRCVAAGVPNAIVRRHARDHYLGPGSSLAGTTTGPYGEVTQIQSYWVSSYGAPDYGRIPGLGEDSAAVLDLIGISAADAAVLVDDGTVRADGVALPHG
jgi:crotonobetainyl-CoA:carnitine CoA-transferase CaiB-like acyl-CoA transferase